MATIEFDRSIPAAPAPAQSLRVDVSFHGRDADDDTDLVTVEEPMEIRLGFTTEEGPTEQSISVTMRTPGDDFDLAAGFLYTEGVIRSLADIAQVEHCGPPSPDKGLRNVVKVTLAENVRFDAGSLMRHFFTSSSCGVCGKASLDAVRIQLPDGKRDAFEIAAPELKRLPEALRASQTEFVRTGGLHASACFDASGGIRRLREDVGRHNALDKLIGSYLEESAPLAGLGILLSGRASFELIQKAAMTRAAFVAAVGPPSSLAVELAGDLGLTLVGFLKADTFNVYVAPQRIV
ncbi:MAG: formate dehydrogenase accessory sulfurtransferase FdhD [Pseudomonadales bacterium]|nr:formate dehydrogenase accessory sulfurtransferase FdhD [Pseudomonadales bacterium]